MVWWLRLDRDLHGVSGAVVKIDHQQPGARRKSAGREVVGVLVARDAEVVSEVCGGGRGSFLDGSRHASGDLDERELREGIRDRSAVGGRQIELHRDGAAL